MPATRARCARPAVLFLAPILVLTLFLLVTSPLSVVSLYALRGTAPPGTWLAREEAAYTETLADRAAFIAHLGGDLAKIESFPLHDKVYTLWDLFLPAFQCPFRVSRIGRLGDGGKWVCGVEELAKKDTCVVYSFGVSHDSSFEADLLRRAPGCEVWGYDFSVGRWGPQMYANKTLARRAHFFPYGLGPRDHHDRWDAPKMWTLQSLMAKNGHTHIDLLKIDIEESEFETLRAIVDTFTSSSPSDPASSPAALPFSQLQLEIHAWGVHGHFQYFLRWWEALERAGLRPFAFEPNLVHVNLQRGKRPDVAEYAFLNVRGTKGLVPELPF